jgi:hypothetical protein
VREGIMRGFRCEAVPDGVLRKTCCLVWVAFLFSAGLSCAVLSPEKGVAPGDQEASEEAEDLQEAKQHRETAVQDVQELLETKEPEDAQQAALEIVSHELREFRKELASIALENKDKETRRVALLALLRLEDTDITDDDKKELLEARTKVLAALEEGKGLLDFAAIREIKHLKLKEFLAELEKTASESKEDGGEAILALARLAEQDVEPFLGDMRKKVRQEVGARKFEAAWAEEIKRVQGNEKEVAKKLLEGTPEERRTAIFEVQAAGLSGCLPMVRKVATTGPTAMVRFEAFRLLDDWDGTQAEEEANVECYREALKAKDENTKLMGAEFLAKRGKREGVEGLIALLESEDANMRNGAVVSLDAAIGTRLSYDPFADAAQRAKAVKEWREWFEKNKERFK